jgi:hypothetical protein
MFQGILLHQGVKFGHGVYRMRNQPSDLGLLELGENESQFIKE